MGRRVVWAQAHAQGSQVAGPSSPRGSPIGGWVLPRRPSRSPKGYSLEWARHGASGRPPKPPDMDVVQGGIGASGGGTAAGLPLTRRARWMPTLSGTTMQGHWPGGKRRSRCTTSWAARQGARLLQVAQCRGAPRALPASARALPMPPCRPRPIPPTCAVRPMLGYCAS